MKYFLFSLLLLCLNYSQLQSQCEFKILASDGSEYDHFGHSIGIENDRMIVGAPGGGTNSDNSPGWAYIYDWNGTAWTETKLLASDGEDNDRFGKAVDIFGDRIVVSAWYDENFNGSVFLFDLVDGAWVETKLVASDGEYLDLFGRHVALTTDRVVVGAHQDDDNQENSGSIYIYDWNGTSWVETKIIASDGISEDNFGFGVSVDEDRVVVGALSDAFGNYQCGSIYIYDWDGSNWVESKIFPSDPQYARGFGVSTAVQGDTIVVGAYLDDENGDYSGSAYIYIWDGSTWVETKLTASDANVSNYFGETVKIEDDRIVISAIGFQTFRGKVYIYDWDGSTWAETSLVASDGSAYKRFGGGLDLSGERIISGAYYDADNGSAAGGIYEYDGPSSISINTFNGNNSDEWNDPTNWSLDLVPTICNHVIIPADKNATILNGLSGICYRLTVENQGVLNIQKNAILDIISPY